MQSIIRIPQGQVPDLVDSIEMSHEDGNGVLNERNVLVERQHATSVIESLQRSIQLSFNVCPIFFIGHIRDAIDTAFGSGLIKKRRPLLIYVHHNDHMPYLFTSLNLIDFLDANYIVWPWDISIESNRQKLIEIWKEYFSEQSLVDFTMDQCPMLIGISKQFSIKNKSFFKYQREVLLVDDVLVRTNEEFDPKTLVYQLIVFKQECEKNEKYLSSGFIQKIVTCPEIILEIAEYLSLNDAIATFSLDILPLLRRYNRNLPVVKPSEEFIKTMIESNNQDKILSLRFEENQFQQIMKLVTLDTFANVRSLIVFNFRNKREVWQMRTYFLNLICLSLWYDGEIDFHNILGIFELIPNSTRQLEIHCDSIRCSHYRVEHLFTRVERLNETVESLVLHLGHISRSLINQCTQSYEKCVLRTVIDLIKIMSNIRYVRIITNRNSIERLLDATEWGNGLLGMCPQLNRIYLKATKKSPASGSLDEKIKQIQKDLHDKRPSLNFQVKVA